MDGSIEELARYLETQFDGELRQPWPDIAELSIGLGVVEASLSAKQERVPKLEEVRAAHLVEAFRAWVGDLHAKLHAAPTTRDKVKAIADAIWQGLTAGSFSKDTLHAQHVYSWARILRPEGKERRVLDCAGVTTTTYAACQALARVHGHEDLQACRMQISEDHCWISLGDGSRESAVEVTTDNAAKRGLPPTAEAWAGWIYCGGHALLCTPQQAVAALAASLNATITVGKKGLDSEGLQLVQARLLRLMLQRHPAALYPAAKCALADLEEIEEQDRLDTAIEAGDSVSAVQIADLSRGPAQGSRDCRPLCLMEDAVADACLDPGSDAAGSASTRSDVGGWQFYVYSYQSGYLFRNVLSTLRCAASFPERAESFQRMAAVSLLGALACCASGGAVLSRYRFCPATDDQLLKDVEGLLEMALEALQAHASGKMGPPGVEARGHLTHYLEFWDGICQLFEGRPKPGGWVAMLLRTAKLFPAETRAAAAAEASTRMRSQPMRKACTVGLWEALKPVALKPLFETADVGGGGEGRVAKRQRA